MQINALLFSGKAGKVIFLLGLLLTFTIASLAQVTTGNLQGVVVDANGAVVAGAAVKVTNTETGNVRETVSNGDGVFNFNLLLPGGKYKIEVNAKGFAPRAIDNVVVNIGTTNAANVSLTAAGVGASVTVTSDQVALLNTDQSQLSTSYGTQQITQLPINGGGIETFALLTPGVVTPGDTDFTNGVGISANGNRGRSNNFQIDGQDNNDNSVAGPSLTLTNTDAIGEVQVITNVFSAEFGRNSGAQINAVTKNGTNTFHGSLFEYLANSALNTRSNADKVSQGNYKFLASNGSPVLAGLAGRTKDPFTNNRFGAAVGGPIKKDKAFFFFTYQGDITRGETSANNIGSDSLVMTAASSTILRSILNTPGTAALVAGGVGGAPAFASVGIAYVVTPTFDSNGDGIVDDFAYGPTNPFGNFPTANKFSDGMYVCRVAARPCPAASLVALDFGEIVRIVPANNSDHQFITREDFSLSSKDNLTIRYIYDNTKFPLATGRFTAGSIFDVPSQNNNLGVSETHNINSSFTNEARFNFSRLFVSFGDTNNLPGPGISFAGTKTDNFDQALAFGTANNLPQSRRVDVYQFQDTLISTIGNHNMRYGADIRYQKVVNFFLPNFLGTDTFNGANPFGGPTSTSGSIPAGSPFVYFDGSDRTGSAATSYENLAMARPSQVVFARGVPLTTTNQKDYFFFFQDDWKVRPSLTLNLGIRYELSTTPFNPLIKQLNASAADASTSIFDTAFPLSSRTATPLPLDKNNWAPRLGFAWSPHLSRMGNFFKDHQTVIRGGFGISYDPSYFNIVLNTITAAPFAAAGTFNQTPGAVGSQSFPFLPTTVAQLDRTPNTNGGDPLLFNQTRVGPNFRGPYSMGYNFGIQQEFGKNSVLEVRYVGTQIRGQFQTINGNPNVRFLNNAAQCLGMDPGSFSNGIVVGSPAASQASACSNGGFHNVNLAINPVTLVNERTTGDGRIAPTSGSVRTRNNGADGTYNGLQARFDQRLGTWLMLNVNYTFSKTLDNSSEIFSTGGGGQGVADAQRFFDTNNGEKGLSAFDQRHSFITNFSWTLPYFRDQKGAKGKFLGGYQLTGIIRLGSGRAYTPLEAFGTYDPSFENGFIGIGALRPFNGNTSAPVGTIAFGYEAACGVLFGGTACNTAGPGNFIIYDTRKPGSPGTVVANAAAAVAGARLVYNDFGLSNQFGVPLSSLEAFNFFKTPYGDVGRNTFFGAPFYGVNLAVFKTTNISEKYKVEFRLEAQNLLNKRNFGVPDAFTEDASFGNFVGSFQNLGANAGATRQLRFGLRFLF